LKAGPSPEGGSFCRNVTKRRAKIAVLIALEDDFRTRNHDFAGYAAAAWTAHWLLVRRHLILDATRFDHGHILSSKILTDLYLISFAVEKVSGS